MALFALHEQDFVLGSLEDFHGLGHRRGIDPVFRIHKKPAGPADRRAGSFHFFQNALVHQRFGHVLADWQLVVFAPEITRKWLFADDMFAGLHRIDDHCGVQIGRRADVDNIQLAVGDQLAKTTVDARYLVPTGKSDNVVTPRRDGAHFNIEAIDTPVGVHVQLRNEAAPDETDPDFRHSRMPPGRRGSTPHLQQIGCRQMIGGAPPMLPIDQRFLRSCSRTN